MKFIKRKPPLMLILVAVLVALLPLLAAFQYVWVGQVSESERERMQSSLSAGIDKFGQDFDRELTRAYLLCKMDAATLRAKAWHTYAKQFSNWVQSPHSEIVKDVYLAHADEAKRLHLSHLNATTGGFETVDWPAGFADLRQRFEQELRNLRFETGKIIRKSPEVIVEEFQSFGQVRQRFEREKESRKTYAEMEQVIQTTFSPIEEEIPALIIPVANIRSIVEDDRLTRVDVSPVFCYTIATLDLDYMNREFIPLLTQRYFSSGGKLDYNIAIVSRNEPGKIIYQSAPELFDGNADSADATAEIFGLRFDEPILFENRFLPPEPEYGRETQAKRLMLHFYDRIETPPPAVSMMGAPRGQWQLAVKHRAGSLDIAVATARRRNLIISFGILLLMAISVAMIIISSRRAAAVARQQMEFVAGVSHELRTPLAVIRSAGENLADGIARDPERVRRYGTLIENEGRRLTEMVEQVLEFAGVERGRKTYELSPVDLRDPIESALAACQPAIKENKIIIEKNIADDLPMVAADRAALSRSIQNLLNNAIKYGGESPRITLKAETRGEEAAITVEDHGLGIAPADLPHIFEPFYRAREVAASQIHGSGLGLSLVKHIVEAHGGSVSVKSSLGRGSSFTLHLPAIGGLNRTTEDSNREKEKG